MHLSHLPLCSQSTGRFYCWHVQLQWDGYNKIIGIWRVILLATGCAFLFDKGDLPHRMISSQIYLLVLGMHKSDTINGLTTQSNEIFLNLKHPTADCSLQTANKRPFSWKVSKHVFKLNKNLPVHAAEFFFLLLFLDLIDTLKEDFVHY